MPNVHIDDYGEIRHVKRFKGINLWKNSTRYVIALVSNETLSL